MLNGTSFCDAKGSVLIIFKASKIMIADSDIPPHGTIGVDHLTFAATEKQIEWWRSKLEDCGAEIVNEIYRKNGAHSIYFKHPAGIILEFEPLSAPSE